LFDILCSVKIILLNEYDDDADEDDDDDDDDDVLFSLFNE